MRDAFVWNLNGERDRCVRACVRASSRAAGLTCLDAADPIVTPEIFAQSVVDDYGLAQQYHQIITKSIQEQLSDYKAHSATFGEDGGMIDEPEEVLGGRLAAGEDAAWWHAWRKRVRARALYRLPDPPLPEARTRKRRKVVKDEAVERPDALAPPNPDAPMAVDEFEEDESLMHEEMRILIKVRRSADADLGGVGRVY